jgi:4-amino-4-deoxy-L-arabinose transferase-like glycosyltransferase
MKLKLLIIILLTIAISIRLAYVLLLPSSQTVAYKLEGLNDEASHLNYVHYLAKNKKFPIQMHHAREKDAFVKNEFEYYQAPVYYILGAFLEIIFGQEKSLLTCRILSFIFGILCLIIIKKIFTYLSFPKHIIYGSVIFTAFLPSHAYFCSVVSNDSLCWLFSLILTYKIIKICEESNLLNMSKLYVLSLICGLILGIGLLVKTSIFIFIPVFIGIYFYKFVFLKKTEWIYSLVILLGVSTILASPWYLRNYLVYNSIFAFDVGNGPPQFFLFDSYHQFIRFCIFAVYSFWFPMQHIPPSHFVGYFLKLETIIILINIILFAVYFLKKARKSLWQIFALFILIFNLIAYLNYNFYWDNADGRFLFPSMIALIIIFCVSLENFLKEFNKEILLIPIIVFECVLPYTLLLLVK